MSTELLDLARSVVALPGWRWMPGMLTQAPAMGLLGFPLRLSDHYREGRDTERDWPHDLGLRYPDLTDAATGGCLLAMLAPCNVTIDSEGDAWMREPGLDPEPFRTLAEACARVALARGRWS